eukprot:CAMPEP_0117496336 /NCGR_PEP_ID=MMETSP0784-20121206/20601_1 /TAXON_ID=39447 /ORGANISM="" /LENGTH=804 /DNA_ID=CAMNT_0005291297 /DNA_START=111 /DNA_END=2522 /DNA_ORIENTATION=-
MARIQPCVIDLFVEPLALRSAAAGGDRLSVSFHKDRGDLGLFFGPDARVRKLVLGAQAAEGGVKVGWRLVAVDGAYVKAQSDFDGYVHRKIKLALSRGDGECQVSFVAPEAEPPKPPVLPRVREMCEKLEALPQLPDKERLRNLNEIEALKAQEKSQVLETHDAVNRLLDNSGVDELTVLLGQKEAKDIDKCHALWTKLRSGVIVTLDDVQGVDLHYSDQWGNTPLHMMQTTNHVQTLLQVAPGERASLLETRNHNGETAVASVMQRASGTDQRAGIVNVLSKCAHSALNLARMEGSVMPEGDDEKEALSPTVAWNEVRAVLVSETVQDFLQGVDNLSKSIEVARPGVYADDYAGFWTEVLFEHCFGCLEVGPIASGAPSTVRSMKHTDVSRQRLLDVFRTIELLLRACSDLTRSAEDAHDLKDIAKGLLTATKGPEAPGFDPREPYRKAFVTLVRDLQRRTARMLQDVFAAAKKDEPGAVREVQEFPVGELLGVDTSGAAARHANGRLRMDSMIVAGDDQVARPLYTPEWVLGQYLDDDAWQGLQRSGVVTSASDIVRIGNSGQTLPAEGMTAERMRFSRLHAVWLRGFCNDLQQQIGEALRAALQLEGDPARGPCPAVGGAKIRAFRARAEAKGVPRLLEKMHEALDEELSAVETRSLLKRNLAEKAGSRWEGETPERTALRELLTPACYVCDINGAEVVVDTFAELAVIYKALLSRTIMQDGHQVVRTKNGFSSRIPKADIDAKGGYRDLKVWIDVRVGETVVAAELQLHIRGFHELKRVMHLPYECSRGSFDHPHLATFW